MTTKEAHDFIRSRSRHPKLGFTQSEVAEMCGMVGIIIHDFDRWIRGSACPMSPDGDLLYYHRDFFKFLRMKGGSAFPRNTFREGGDLEHLRIIVRNLKLSMLE